MDLAAVPCRFRLRASEGAALLLVGVIGRTFGVRIVAVDLPPEFICRVLRGSSAFVHRLSQLPVRGVQIFPDFTPGLPRLRAQILFRLARIFAGFFPIAT